MEGKEADIQELKEEKKEQKEEQKKEAKKEEEPNEDEEKEGKKKESGGSDGETVFEVEKIVGTRKRRGVTQYLIHWKGFGKDDETWENEENLDCDDLIKEFKKKEEPTTSEKPKRRTRKGIVRIVGIEDAFKADDQVSYQVKKSDDSTDQVESEMLRVTNPEMIIEYLEKKLFEADSK